MLLLLDVLFLLLMVILIDADAYVIGGEGNSRAVLPPTLSTSQLYQTVIYKDAAVSHLSCERVAESAESLNIRPEEANLNNTRYS